MDSEQFYPRAFVAGAVGGLGMSAMLATAVLAEFLGHTLYGAIVGAPAILAQRVERHA